MTPWLQSKIDDMLWAELFRSKTHGIEINAGNGSVSFQDKNDVAFSPRFAGRIHCTRLILQSSKQTKRSIFSDIFIWQIALVRRWSQAGPASLPLTGFDVELDKNSITKLTG